MLIMPVSNGLLPRPQGGRITGVFLLEQAGKTLKKFSNSEDLLLCPAGKESPPWIYPVGVAARIFDMWQESAVDSNGRETALLMAGFEGRSHARWNTLQETNGILISDSVEYMDLKKMRSDYPVISGAGWPPAAIPKSATKAIFLSPFTANRWTPAKKSPSPLTWAALSRPNRHILSNIRLSVL